MKPKLQSHNITKTLLVSCSYNVSLNLTEPLLQLTDRNHNIVTS